MLSVSVPKDLTAIKSKVIWNLTKRQLICFGAAALIGIPFYIFTKDYIGVEVAAFLMVTIMLPFFFLAMYQRDGIPAEKILYLMIKQKFIMPKKRPYISENIHEVRRRRDKLKEELKELKKKPDKTWEDRKRIKKITKILDGTDFSQKLPESSQKTVTFETIYPDGICKVKPRYYTKMVEFFDLNYVLLDETERAEVLGLYSRLINYFDSNVKFQLFLFNRRVSKETLESKFEISPQGDAFDEIRGEYSDMLKAQSAKGTNGVIKSKYLVFGIEAKNHEEAKRTLMGIENEVIKNFRTLGASARGLDGKERLSVLHEYFHQDTLEPFHFSYKKMEEYGDTVKDSIVPKSFDFSEAESFKMGKMRAKSFYVSISGAVLDEEMLRKILDIDTNFSVSMHMESLSPRDAQRLVRKSLVDVRQNKIDEQKKASRGGYDIDLTPEKINEYEEGAKKLLDELNTSNTKLIKTCLIITVFGKNKNEMNHTIQRISGIVEQIENALRPLTYMQEQAMNATAPIGIKDIPITRILNTSSAAVLVPFNTQELFMKGQALYYGINSNTSNMIMADRKKLRTPNGVILGTPGSGKSFAAKREILGVFLSTGDDIIVCDPEGEYPPVIDALGGEVVKLSSGSKDYLNPMDIQLSHKNDREALKIKSDFIITLCDVIAGGEKGLANDEKGIIDRCITKIYDKYFENPDPERMPILEDLYNALLHYEPGEVEKKLAMDARRKAVRIANSLVLYVNGSQNYFNHRTNVDSHNRIICFDIRDLGNQLKELGMLIVQDAVWNRVSKNRERKVATRYYCDEFHLLLREKQTAQYCVEIWKRFRKWGGIPTAMTQNVGDFLRSEEIEGILGNSDFVYLLNQNAKDQEILVGKLGLSNEELKHVTSSEQGSGIMFFDNVVIPFVDRYPKDTKTYAIMNTKPEEEETDYEGYDNGRF